MSLFRKGVNFIKYRLVPPHNMFTHRAERFYFEEYAPHILPYFLPSKTLLDIGCQMGRFTIPAVESGMKVTATDIKPGFFKYIKKKLKSGADITFKNETLDQTLDSEKPERYDVVLCIELLYNLPHPAENLAKLSKLVKPGGVLITSNRSKGYYIYRFIREQNYNAVNHILEGVHTNYNAQWRNELESMHLATGLKVKKILPIGLFSGFGSDAFSGIANPSKLDGQKQAQLINLENMPQLHTAFGEACRYWLVISG